MKWGSAINYRLSTINYRLLPLRLLPLALGAPPVRAPLDNPPRPRRPPAGRPAGVLVSMDGRRGSGSRGPVGGREA